MTKKNIITFENATTLISSSNMTSYGDGYSEEIVLDGKVVGLIRGTSFQLGEYPNEEYFGEYRKLSSCRNAAIREIKKRLKDGRL